jgi:CubicO group peptidase (beta-lactamase class C family)
MKHLPIGVWTEKMRRVWKSFCCLQARTIDFAKFGRLYLNKGNWEGNQIVSRAWVEQSTHTDPSNSRHYYNNNWELDLKYNSFYAVGFTVNTCTCILKRIFKLFDLRFLIILQPKLLARYIYSNYWSVKRVKIKVATIIVPQNFYSFSFI